MAVVSVPARPDPMSPYRCANWRKEGPACDNPGWLPCEACHLVIYCSPACQKAHADVHLHDCEHEVAQPAWITKWFAEGRTPEFLMDGEITHPLTRRVPRGAHTWGNMPAVDMLDVSFNEGEASGRHLRVLTVDGDLRHGVRTVARLPEAFVGQVSFTIGNGNMDMCARNIILAMLTFLVPNKAAAVDCMIHVWYSAYLKPSHVRILRERIRPFIVEAAQLAAGHPVQGAVFTRSMIENDRGLRVSLTAAEWTHLLQYFDFDQEDDLPEHRYARSEIVANGAFDDERDLVLLRNEPHRRVAILKYRQDGILQPFGHSCLEYTVPNPTLFRDGNWIVEELADPFDGWDLPAVLNHTTQMPRSDMYGRLYCHLKELFSIFLTQAHQHMVVFDLYQMEPERLCKYVQPLNFARVDVTSMTEHTELEPEEIFEMYAPLLEAAEDNPHAAMIGLCIQGIEETLVKHEDLGPSQAQREAVASLLGLSLGATEEPHSGNVIRHHDALPLVLDFDKAFRRWKRTSSFLRHLHDNGLELKSRNTVIKEWPRRVVLENRVPMDALKRAFLLHVSSPHGGCERIVELRRVPAHDWVMKK